MKRHFCQSVRGALKNWSREQWINVAQDNKLTVSEVKNKMMDYLVEGKKVIPMCEDECNNFSYTDGCLGHE